MDLPVWASLSFNMPLIQDWPPKEQQRETQGIPQQAQRFIQQTVYWQWHNTRHEFHMGFNLYKKSIKEEKKEVLKPTVEISITSFPPCIQYVVNPEFRFTD